MAGPGSLVRMSDGGLNLDDFGDLIERPSVRIRRQAEERRARTGLPAKALGRLDELGAPGAGLGLAIVADLAALHGGALRLDRSDLGGLAALLDLPA